MTGPRTTLGELETVLMPGTGFCLDVGCGDGRHRAFIESKGYAWFGVDLRYHTQLSSQANALQLPIASGVCDVVVSWQSLEHFPRPWIAIQDIQRVLKIDGLFCGSTSFLEPFHDYSYFGFSELGLRQLLSDHGFTNITIIPGINAFPLMSWTLFSRMAGGRLAGLALSMSSSGLSLVNHLYPLANRLFFKLNRSLPPRLEDSYWFRQAPFDFAGHLAFRAYKAA